MGRLFAKNYDMRRISTTNLLSFDDMRRTPKQWRTSGDKSGVFTMMRKRGMGDVGTLGV